MIEQSILLWSLPDRSICFKICFLFRVPVPDFLEPLDFSISCLIFALLNFCHWLLVFLSCVAPHHQFLLLPAVESPPCAQFVTDLAHHTHLALHAFSGIKSVKQFVMLHCNIYYYLFYWFFYWTSAVKNSYLSLFWKYLYLLLTLITGIGNSNRFYGGCIEETAAVAIPSCTSIHWPALHFNLLKSHF